LAQDSGNTLGTNINTDAAYEKMQPNESPFIKGLEAGINANPDLGIGTDNNTGEGQNNLVLTPTRSNVQYPNTLVPSGYNKNIGCYESINTQELYYFNFNGDGNHGIYVCYGNTGLWQKVIIDAELGFTDNQENFIASHRVILRIRKNELGEIIEKYLLITDGNSWHKWIDVIASIKTNGFDYTSFPYFTLQPPHFDRRELLEWAVRHPMVCPIVTKLPNTDAEKNKVNYLLDHAFEFCYQYVNTDGRLTLVSPFSVPVIIKRTDFLANPDFITKRLLLKFAAGSPKTEKINIYVRSTLKSADSDLALTFGDWYKYDTIHKFTDTGSNSKEVIGNDYWLRTNQWADYNYDTVFNTIEYVFDNTKLGLVTDQDLFLRLNNEMPQLSVALSDLGDAAQLVNNRIGYDNFSGEVIDNLGTEVIESITDYCAIPTRKVVMYVYAGRLEVDLPNPYSSLFGQFISQVGYYYQASKEMMFGGQTISIVDKSTVIVPQESELFKLDFADKKGFRCYLKGTPYFADCEWCVVDKDRVVTPIDHDLNALNQNDKRFISDVVKNKGYFIGRFTFEVPAGKYIAALGRHNKPSGEDYRSVSTYVVGIADSTQTTAAGGIITLDMYNSVGNRYHKEIEIDCTGGDVDLWGRGSLGDTFYVFTPAQLTYDWKFMEGYLKEDSTAGAKSVEKFLYIGEKTGGWFYSGVFTDKNGFYFLWAQSNDANVLFSNKINCVYPKNFTVNFPAAGGWFPFIDTYLNVNTPTPNNMKLNRVIVSGRITDITGTVPFSNISVSIVNGETVVTDTNGYFTLIVHNGLKTLRTDNIYVNAAGNFLVTLNDCGQIPIFQYQEPVCSFVNYNGERVFYNIFNNIVNDTSQLELKSQTFDAVSLKSSGNYIVTIVGADLASRTTFANRFSTQTVPSFLERDGGIGNINPTKLKWLLNGALRLNKNVSTKDIAWLGFFVSKANNYRNYLQWVGDKVEYITASGKVTKDATNASLIRITISSLLDTNIKNNFTLLSTYQFQLGDRLRVYDNGDNVLLNTATYGASIDTPIEGTNYNQAAVNANLISPATNTVLSGTATTGTEPTTIYVKYDSRFNELKDKVGFWVEMYTPIQNEDKLPFLQAGSFYPIINGEIAEYTGGGYNNPQYNYPTSGELDYWDTYFLTRNILGLGKYIGHPFESQNITDIFGANGNSGGKLTSTNEYALQQWYADHTIKSDDYVTEGIKNGLSNFRSINAKTFKGYKRGGIMAVSCQYSVILFICENDWFVTDYDYNYIFANAQGIQVANLTNNLGQPHQKIGDNFGCKYEDTGTILMYDKFLMWLDRKNAAFIICDYRSAVDVSKITDEQGHEYGIKTYLQEKIKTIEQFNLLIGSNEKRFDIISGIDLVKKNVYLTFRPRRKNSNKLSSYINKRRGIDLKYQETVVYNIDKKRWIKWENFTPESYGTLRGAKTGVEFLTFAAGLPYIHNQQGTETIVHTPEICCPEGFTKVGDTCVKTTKTPIEGFIINADNLNSITSTVFEIISSNGFVIDWGDGTLDSFNSGTVNPTHLYSTPYTGNIIIAAADLTTITKISFSGLSGVNPLITPLEIASTELSKLDGALHFNFNDFVNITGTIEDMPQTLTRLSVSKNTLSGNIGTLASSLLYLSIEGSNTVSGNTNELTQTGVLFFRINGSNTITGDIDNFPKTITELYINGANTLNGTIADLPPNLIATELLGNNTVSGSIATIPSTTSYFYCYGDNTLSGNLSALSVTMIAFSVDGNNTITGLLNDLPNNIESFLLQGLNTVTGNLGHTPANLNFIQLVGNNNVDTYTAKTWVTPMNTFYFSTTGVGLIQAEVDLILVNLSLVTTWIGNKSVTILGNNVAAPSATGIAARSILISNGVTVTTN